MWRKPERTVGKPSEAYDHAICLSVYARDHARPTCEVTKIIAGRCKYFLNERLFSLKILLAPVQRTCTPPS